MLNVSNTFINSTQDKDMNRGIIFNLEYYTPPIILLYDTLEKIANISALYK